MIDDDYILMLSTAARGGIRSVVESYSDEFSLRGIRHKIIFSHAEGGFFYKQFVFLSALLKLFYALIFTNVRLVHLHSAMRGSFYRKTILSFFSKSFGVPVVFHLHGSEMKVFYEKQNWFGKFLISKSFSFQNVVLVLSHSWFLYVKNISKDANVVVLPNCVKLPDVFKKPVNKEFCFSFLGFVGERKGIYDLLPCFAAALNMVPNMKLIVGGNGEVERAKKMADDLGIAHAVVFLGWITGQEKIDVLKGSDVYVLPSYNEGLPISILEAMSYHLPVISTNVGGIPELVRDGVDGYILNPGDTQALVKALVKMALDNELREAMASSSYERIVSCYSDKAVFPLLFDVYKNLN